MPQTVFEWLILSFVLAFIVVGSFVLDDFVNSNKCSVANPDDFTCIDERIRMITITKIEIGDYLDFREEQNAGYRFDIETEKEIYCTSDHVGCSMKFHFSNGKVYCDTLAIFGKELLDLKDKPAEDIVELVCMRLKERIDWVEDSLSDENEFADEEANDAPKMDSKQG